MHLNPIITEASGFYSGLLGSAANPHLFLARLTTESNTPYSVSDRTAQTTIYLTPLSGADARVSVYNGSKWVEKKLTQKSVAVPSTLFRLFDVFLYDNAGTLTLETTDWNQTTGSITAATAALPCVITSTAHGNSVGDLIGVAGITGTLGTNSDRGLNGRIFRVSATAADTMTLEGSDTQSLTYTSGGTWYKIPNTRATALATQDGVYVKSGATTRRYVGTCMTTGVSGQTEDSEVRRFVWNYYNRFERKLKKIEATDNWTYNVDAWRPTNNRIDNRVQVVVGVRESLINLRLANIAASDSAGDYAINSIVRNRATTATDDCWAQVGGGAANLLAVLAAHLNDIAPLGYSFYQWVETRVGAGILTFYSESSDLRKSGMTGSVWG
jgi:hypothetical protein